MKTTKLMQNPISVAATDDIFETLMNLDLIVYHGCFIVDHRTGQACVGVNWVTILIE